jgi:hypothetical protein
MPYPNEHSCRLIPPDKFEQDSFRRINNGKLDIIIGKLKGESKTTAQAYRYKKEDWTEEEARKHCSDNNGAFTPAGQSEGFADNPHVFSFYAALHSLVAKDHSALFYLMNTSENRNGWAVTEKGLKEALPTVKKAPLGIGPDYKFDKHYNDGLDVGKFAGYSQPDPSYALATANVTDDKVWGMLESGELGPVSVVVHSYRETCSKCGVVFSGEENPREHACIKSGKAHEQLESFVFNRVDFIDVPAYPQAGLLELAAKLEGHAVPIEVLASFYVSQEHPISGVYHKKNEEKTLTENENEQKIASLEQANTTLTKDLEAAVVKADANGKTVEILKAQLDKIQKETHNRLVTETFGARVEAGVAGKPDEEKTMLTAQTDETLTILKTDAIKVAATLNVAGSSPKTKYAKTSGDSLENAVKEMRADLGFPARKEEP